MFVALSPSAWAWSKELALCLEGYYLPPSAPGCLVSFYLPCHACHHCPISGCHFTPGWQWLSNCPPYLILSFLRSVSSSACTELTLKLKLMLTGAQSRSPVGCGLRSCGSQRRAIYSRPRHLGTELVHVGSDLIQSNHPEACITMVKLLLSANLCRPTAPKC